MNHSETYPHPYRQMVRIATLVTPAVIGTERLHAPIRIVIGQQEAMADDVRICHLCAPQAVQQ